MPNADDKRFCLVTLGCKANQYESRALAEAWTRAGWVRTTDPALADHVVLCSCAVTARAEAEGRRLARTLVREARPGVRVSVTGCAAVVAPDAFAALGAVPAPDKAHLASHPLAPVKDTVRPPDDYPELAVSGYDRARALVKIQDGCSHGCTYCIVPAARGPSVSRPFAAILAEVERLLAAGHREIGLTGINLGHYGRDLRPVTTFWELVAALEDALATAHGGTARLRLGSLDPAMLDDAGLSVLARSRFVCPHLHISLQSADPAILTAMGRRPTDAAAVSSFVDKASMLWPDMALGLDILTGFPGESEAAFQTTADFLAASPLTYAHVFPYSRRPGTRAAGLPGQLPREVKAARAKILRELAEAKSSLFLERLCAAPVLSVALERTRPAAGTCSQYVDCQFVEEPDAALGSLVAARPVAADGPILRVVPAKLQDRP
jgi:MiaB/RimO family radical SAM methylthiotransferase